ncbi:MAG: sugar phosphate isomerase/epimerase [Clostridia bacterium]|nr:sugar phosphate isomerase/epimerase [Clostridia bacterium]
MDKRIGAQLFTLRNHIKTIEDFDTTCKRVSEMGYKTVQISGTPLGAKEMREVLDKYGLICLTTHRNAEDFINKIDEVIEYNKTLGCDLCGMGIMPIEAAKDKAELDKFIADMNKVCEKLKEAGMYFGYHNHGFEFVKLDGKTIYDYLIDETDPEVFNFIVDTYWVQYGGLNPAKLIEKLGKRAMAIHFKDFGVEIGERTVPCIKEVGQGNLCWDSIIEACEKAGSRFALVEQDSNWQDDDPFLSMKMSYDFLCEKGFN